MFKIKKYAGAAHWLTVLSFLLLTLYGCNATSDTMPHYQATGSWQGTIGADQVYGIIAPDSSFHLAITDASGNSVGEYVGAIGSIDEQNIGRMTLTRLQAGETSGVLAQITFKLSADRLYSDQNVELRRTPDANGPAVQDDVVGHWSLLATDNTTDAVINADGTVSGGDGVNCQYSGTISLVDPAWNIFSLNMTLTQISGGLCNDAAYSGLAMVLPPENERSRLWLAANAGNNSLFGEWAETQNSAPVAAMTILGERADQSVLVQKISPLVELDAQDSSDANNDALTYTWSGKDYNGTPLLITLVNASGSAATFVPVEDPDPARELWYELTLTVNDGIVSTTVTQQLRVEWTPARFVSCDNGTDYGNGTVLDTKTNLLWLKDAGCAYLNYELLVGGKEEWGVSAPTAQDRVATLYDDGLGSFCGLSDGSALGDWQLPTRSEFDELIYPDHFPAPPQLLNSLGGGQWSEGDAFINVGTSPINLGTIENPSYTRYLYWTNEPVPDSLSWYFADFNYTKPEDRIASYFINNPTAVWPVRALRPDEECLPKP